MITSLAFAVYFGTIANNFYTIFIKPNDGQKFYLKDLLFYVFMYWAVMISVLALAFVGSEPLINQEITGLHQSPMFFICLLSGLLQQHMSTHIMFSHICKQKYQPLHNKLCLFIILTSMIVIYTNHAMPTFFVYYKVSILSCIQFMLGTAIIC